MSKKILALIIAGLLLLFAFVLFTRTPYWIALTKSKKHFIENSRNNSVFYEPGAKKYADKIVDYFPVAIQTVEESHLYPFPKPFNIYVCNSQKSLNEFAATKSFYPIRGTVLTGNILIAPSAFNFEGKDTHKETLMHELSHLHFRQRLGFFKDRKIPQWFREGFADYVAGSGGEGIEEISAIKLILNGRHFVPEEKGEIFGSFSEKLVGLSGPMFHKQVSMLVTYMAESDSLRFKSFILRIQNGDPFGKSFKEAMNTDVQSKWKQFILHLDTIKNDLAIENNHGL